MRFLSLPLLLALAISGSADEHAAIRIFNPVVQGGLVFGQVPAGSSLALDGELLTVDDQGRFVLGFGRDSAKPRLLFARLPTGETMEQELRPQARRYDIERVNGLPEATVNPPPEVSVRISREANLIAAARATSRRSSDWASSFIWPAKGRISGVYGSQRTLNGEPKRPHYGVDLAAPEGTLVVAPAAGLVKLAETDLYYSGGTIILDHGDFVSSTFLHMQDVMVTAGDYVAQGQTIGTVGATGRATGAHLDWRMNWRHERVDPRLLLEPDSWLQAD